MALKLAEEEEKSPQGRPEEPSKFQELMKCAVAVKSSQMATKRRRFDQLPIFEQASLYLQRKHRRLRTQRLKIKILAFDSIFEAARKLSKKGELDRAAHKLEEVVALPDLLGLSNFPPYNLEKRTSGLLER